MSERSSSTSKLPLVASAIFILLGLAISTFHTTSAFSAQLTLAWDPSSESNVAGYKVHYGLSSRTYSTVLDVGSQTTCVLPDLQPGSVYFIAATAYDLSRK